jgi:hypothetical protein
VVGEQLGNLAIAMVPENNYRNYLDPPVIPITAGEELKKKKKLLAIHFIHR